MTKTSVKINVEISVLLGYGLNQYNYTRRNLLMNEVKSKRIIKLLVVVMLLAALILPTNMLTNVVQAATKPSINTTITIGTGSIVGNFDYYSKTEDKYSLSVSSPVKNATYSFTSSNTKIVTVKASGTNAYLTGIKAGTATITCNQKLSGKTTKVGTCKVTVVNSSLYKQDSIPELPLGTGMLPEAIEINTRNNDATYTFTSDNKNFSIKETIKVFDGMNFINHSFTAKAAGTYTVTVKETYNKVTRTLGKLKYIVKKATVPANETIDLGANIDAYQLINNYRTDVKYFVVTEDENIISGNVENGVLYLTGKTVGTTNIKIYENTTKADQSKLIGTCKLTVKEVILENLICDFDETEAYIGGDPIEFYVEKEPYNFPGTINVTSSDTSVATVASVDEDGTFEVTPVGAGTTTITITCGDKTKTQDITISANSDESEDDYED